MFHDHLCIARGQCGWPPGQNQIYFMTHWSKKGIPADASQRHALVVGLFHRRRQKEEGVPSMESYTTCFLSTKGNVNVHNCSKIKIGAAMTVIIRWQQIVLRLKHTHISLARGPNVMDILSPPCPVVANKGVILASDALLQKMTLVTSQLIIFTLI